MQIQSLKIGITITCDFCLISTEFESVVFLSLTILQQRLQNKSPLYLYPKHFLFKLNFCIISPPPRPHFLFSPTCYLPLPPVHCKFLQTLHKSKNFSKKITVQYIPCDLPNDGRVRRPMESRL